MSVTMFLSIPTKAFTVDDFPTLGRPTKAIRGMSPSSISIVGSNPPTNASNKSPVHDPLTDEIG